LFAIQPIAEGVGEIDIKLVLRRDALEEARLWQGLAPLVEKRP
jgi:hypothetical protein